MRIAIDGTPAINDIRAIRRYCHNLILELSRLESDLDFSLLYLGYREGQNILPPMQDPHFKEMKSKIPGKILKSSWRFFNQPDISFWIKDKIDILHFPGGYTYIPNRCKIVLTTLHGFYQINSPQCGQSRERDSVINKLNFTINNSKYFITVSENNKRELMELWKIQEERITAIPLGISPEFKEYEISPDMRAEILKRYAIPDKKFILYVGALEPHKNIGNIISSYAILGTKWHGEFNLILVGSKTSYCDSYRQQIQDLKISEYVQFIDYIEPGSIDLAYLYNLAELFVFPSFYEGWASPPLEAMRCGTPVLVSNIPSLRESTGDIAIYCDPNIPEDISQKIQDILSDKSKHKELKLDGLRFSSEYTWKRCAEKTLALYEKLLS